MTYQHGGDIYTTSYRLDFSANIGPFGMNPKALDAAKEALYQSHAYPDTQCRELKKALAESLSMASDYFVIGNGAADLIFSLALAARPKQALILAPGFAEYEQALRTVDCELLIYEREENQNFELGEDFLQYLKKQCPDMVFLCNPDNPTGDYLTKDYLKEILELCEEKNGILIVDESFIQFAVKEEAETLSTFISEHPKLFLLRSFTKMYGLPGLRLGYGICSDAMLMEKLDEYRQPWSVSIPAQAAGVAVLQDKEWVEKTRTYVEVQREVLQSELQKLGFQVYPSRGNFLMFYSDVELVEPLKEKGILIRDCSNFRGLKKGYYRIAVKKEEENRELLQALKEVLRK